MVSVVHALSGLANVRRVNFMPAAIVVELVSDDGREYPRRSLPNVVANRRTTYHHASYSFFFYSTRDQTREREDPSQYPAGPHPQDETNYIREPEQGMFSPGMGFQPDLLQIPGLRYLTFFCEREILSTSQWQTMLFRTHRCSTPRHTVTKSGILSNDIQN